MTANTASSINQILDNIREHHDLRSDIALSEYLDVNPTTVWRWRSGHINPSCIKLLNAVIALKQDYIDQPAPVVI